MFVTLPDDLLNPLRGSMSGSAGAKTETRFRKLRIEDRWQNLSDGLLNETIEHVWNTERSLAATVFRDGFPTHSNSRIVMPSGPGAPRFFFTLRHARSRFPESTTFSNKSASGETLRDGVSTNTGSVTSGRRNFADSVGSSSFPKSNVRYVAPRSKFVGRSSLFFMVRSFLSSLECDDAVQ